MAKHRTRAPPSVIVTWTVCLISTAVAIATTFPRRPISAAARSSHGPGWAQDEAIVTVDVVVYDVVSMTESAVRKPPELKVRTGEGKLTIDTSRSWRTLNGEFIIYASIAAVMQKLLQAAAHETSGKLGVRAQNASARNCRGNSYNDSPRILLSCPGPSME